MALTSRDVMFVMRAQDMASREVRGLATSFGTLGKQIKDLDDQLRTRLNDSMAKQARQLETVRAAYRNLEGPLKSQNSLLSTQNAQLNAYKNRINETGRTEALFRSTLQKSLNTRKESLRTIQNETNALERQVTNRSTAVKMTDNERRGIQNVVAAKRNYIASEQESINQMQRAINTRRGMSDSVRNHNRLIRAQIDNNRVRMSQNTEMVASARQVRDAQVRYIQDQSEAEQAAYREYHRREVDKRRQQQAAIERQFMLSAALTTFGVTAGAIGAQVIGAFTSMAVASAELQKGFALAQVQSAGTVRSTQQLREVSMGIAREIPAAYDQMDKVLFRIFTSTNSSVTEAERLLRGFAMEAVASQADMEAAARSTIAIMNALEMDTAELGRIQDVQFEIIRKGVITYDEMSASIGRALPATRRAGQSIETLGAMFSFLTRNGLDARMAATSAARALESFAHPRTVARLEDMGVTVRDSVTGEFMPLVDVIGDLHAIMGDMTTPERTAAMQALFMGSGGTIQARRFWDTAIASFEQFRMHVEFMENSQGAMQDAYDIMFQEPAVLLDHLRNQLLMLRDTVGVALLSGFRPFVEMMDTLISIWLDLDPRIQNLIVKVTLFTGAILTLAGVITTAIGIWLAFNAAVVASGVGISAVRLAFYALAGSTGIGAVIVAIGLLITYWDEVTASIQGVIDWFKEGDRIAATLATTLVGLVGVLATWLAGVGPVVAVVSSLGGAATVAARGVGALAIALKGFLVAHPVLLAMGALAAIVYKLGEDSRKTSAAVDAHTQALAGVEDQVLGSVEGFRNYRQILDEAHAAASRAAMQEGDLLQVMEKQSVLRTNEIIPAIMADNDVREEQIQKLQRHRQELIDSTSAAENHFAMYRETNQARTDEINAIDQTIEFIRRESEARDRAEEAIRRNLRAHSDLGSYIATYMELQDQGGFAADRASAKMREQIEVMLSMGESHESVDAILAELGTSMDELGIEVDQTSSAIEYAEGVMANWEMSWQSIGGIVDGVVGLYQEKLAEMNAANAEAASEQERTYTDMAASLSLYNEALTESSNELDWALEAQSNLRTEYGNEVVAWWSQMYQEEPALARELYAELEAGNDEHFQRMLEMRQKHMDFVLRDLEAHGIELVDENGNINTDIIEITAEIMGQHPILMERLLEESNTIMEAKGEAAKKLQDDTWRELYTISNRRGGQVVEEAEDMAEGIRKSIEDGKTPSEREMEILMGMVKATAENGAELTVEGMAEKLEAGVGEISRIANKYNVQLAGGLNPILKGLGQPSIRAFQGQLNAYRRNKGGVIPGGGPDKDSVLIHGTPGEYVVRRKSAQSNLEALEHLNRTGALPQAHEACHHEVGSRKIATEQASTSPTQATIRRLKEQGTWYGRRLNDTSGYSVPSAISSWNGNAGALSVRQGGGSAATGIIKVNRPNLMWTGAYFSSTDRISLNWGQGKDMSARARQGTTAHEIGHALGLGHVPNQRSLMNAYNRPNRANRPGAVERNLMARLYPRGSNRAQEARANQGEIQGGRVATATAPNTQGSRFWWVDDVPKPPTNYRPPVRPITSPAHAVNEHAYEVAVDYVRKNGTPPIEGPFPTGSGDSGVWRQLAQAIKAVPGARVVSAYRPGARTAGSGRRSFHSMGRAIDIAGRGRMDTATMGRAARWIAQRYPNATELIYSPGPSLIRGRPYNPQGITRRNHYDHVHWAMAQGGVINEPVFGVGASGQTYSFGEQGPEQVSPLSGGSMPNKPPVVGIKYSPPNVGRTRIPLSIKGDELAAIKEQIKANKLLMRVREMNHHQLQRYLTEAISKEVKYSDEWLRLVEERQRAYEEATQERMEIEDNMFELQLLNVDRYIRVIDKRASKEKAYTNEWVALQKQKLDLIETEQRKTWDLARGDLNAQLQLMDAQQRVAEARKLVEEGGRGSAERAEAEATLQEAKAAVAYAEFDAARLSGLADAIEEHDELRAMLMRFEAEAGLADANKQLAEAEQNMQSQVDSAEALRRAEIDLALAEMDLVEASQQATKSSDTIRNSFMSQTEAAGLLASELERLVNSTKALADIGINFNLSSLGITGQVKSYDSGGILPPGVTLAVNKTGKPEGVFTKDQLGNLGTTITVEEGAVQLNFNGPVDSASIDDVKNYVDRTFEELIDQLRRN